MNSEHPKADDALADGWAFARDAWRDLWPVQSLFSLGIALMFLSQMGMVGAVGGDLFVVGLVVAAITVAPLYSSLYRIEIGGPSERTLGPGGLQLGWAEGRLWALWGARAAGFAGVGLAATTLAAIVFIVFKPLGVINAGPLGTWLPAFFIAAAVWLAAIGLAVYAAARLSLSSPASIDQDRLILSPTWFDTKDTARSLMAVWAAVRVPLVALFVAFCLADSLVNGRMSLRDWPIVTAGIFGLFAGGILGFVQAPLAVGALTSFYRHRPAHEANPMSFAELAGFRPHPVSRPYGHSRPNDPVARIRAVLADNAQPFHG